MVNEFAAPNGSLPTVLLGAQDCVLQGPDCVPSLLQLMVRPKGGAWEGTADETDLMMSTLGTMLRTAPAAAGATLGAQGVEVAAMALCEQHLRPYQVWSWWSEAGPMHRLASEAFTRGLPDLHSTYQVKRKRKASEAYLKHATRLPGLPKEGAVLERQAHAAYVALEGILGGRPFFAGGTPGAVDAKVFSHLILHLLAPSSERRLLDTAEHPRLLEYVQQCSKVLAEAKIAAAPGAKPVECRFVPAEDEEVANATSGVASEAGKTNPPWTKLSTPGKLKRVAPYLVGLGIVLGFFLWRDMEKSGDPKRVSS